MTGRVAHCFPHFVAKNVWKNSIPPTIHAEFFGIALSRTVSCPSRWEIPTSRPHLVITHFLPVSACIGTDDFRPFVA